MQLLIFYVKSLEKDREKNLVKNSQMKKLKKLIEQNEKDIAEADTEINIFGGVFDFSDDKQRAVSNRLSTSK